MLKNNFSKVQNFGKVENKLLLYHRLKGQVNIG